MKDLKSTGSTGDERRRPAESYAFGPFRLNGATRELLRGQGLVALTPKAFDTLCVLVTRADRVVEKNELLRLVWPDAFVSEDTLTQNIATLRKALGDVPDHPQYIMTVPRYGYRFIAPIQASASQADNPVPVGTPQASSTSPEAPVHGLDHLQAQASAAPLVHRRNLLFWISGTVVVTLVMIMAAGPPIAYFRRAAASAPAVMRFAFAAPEGTIFSPSASFPAISPNGRFLAFLASRPGSETRLWVRSLDSLSARELSATDGATSPFWSPDSRSVGFVANGKLKKVTLLGEPPDTLCDTGSGVAFPTWGRDGVILFSQTSGIYRTSSTGEVPIPVTTIDSRRGETAHLFPQFLPDGRHFLYLARSAAGQMADSWIVLRSLDSSGEQRLFSASSQALYADPGYLLFMREGTLFAQPFDAARLRLSGEPLAVPETEGVGFNPATPRGMFSASQNGVAAYRLTAGVELGWFDRAGKSLGLLGAAGYDSDPALSVDGQRVAVSRYDLATNTRSIWILDLARPGSVSRLTSRKSWDVDPVWSPDGTKIIFASGPAANAGKIYEKDASGGAEERALPKAPSGHPLDWSRDGRYVVYATGSLDADGPPTRGPTQNLSSATQESLWLLPLSDGGDPKRLSGTSLNESQGQISPNGRWLAYVSEVSGRPEIFVRSFPQDSGRTWQVSAYGGVEPQWRRDGHELFFIGANQELMAVSVNTEGAFRAGVPTTLFLTKLTPRSSRLGILGRNQYVVTGDGQRFLIRQPRLDAAPSQIIVLINWPAALKR